MLNGRETARFQTRLPFAQLLDEVESALRDLGRIDVHDSGDVSGTITRGSSFACDIHLDGWVEKRKGQDEYKVTLEYSISPSVVIILLAVFLFPIGLVIGILLVTSAQSEVQRNLRLALDDLGDALEGT